MVSQKEMKCSQDVGAAVEGRFFWEKSPCICYPVCCFFLAFINRVVYFLIRLIRKMKLKVQPFSVGDAGCHFISYNN